MKKGIKLLVFICLMLCMISNKTEAATPRVMVSDYKIEEGKVIGGKEFNLKIILKNTANADVRNIKVTLYTENGEILPVEGAGTSYIDKISAKGEQEFQFKMETIHGLEEKSYKLSVKIEYEGSNGMEYTVEEALFLPVQMEQRVSITDIYMEKTEYDLGDTVDVSAMINNLGDGTLYNVVAKVSGDNVEEVSTYVGNIEPGKKGMMDILTKAKVVTKGAHKFNKIQITYEDKEGTVLEEKTDITVDVVEPIYDNLEKVADPQKNKKVWKIGLEIFIGLIILIGGIIFYIRYQKRKREKLEEFMK